MAHLVPMADRRLGEFWHGATVLLGYRVRMYWDIMEANSPEGDAVMRSYISG